MSSSLTSGTSCFCLHQLVVVLVETAGLKLRRLFNSDKRLKHSYIAVSLITIYTRLFHRDKFRGVSMQVAAELVSIAITLVLLLLTSAITVTADEVGQHIHQQRILNTWMVDDAGCHETMLSNSPFVPNITLVQGIVFSLRSTSASSVSSISVYLDEAAITPSVQFDLFTMNGDGTNSIGTTLDGSGDWKRIHGGTIADTQLDEDGATFLGSFGNPISLGAGDVKSFYLSFTKSIIRVSPYSANTADAWDANAISLNGHSMQISVGRAVSSLSSTCIICIYFT